MKSEQMQLLPCTGIAMVNPRFSQFKAHCALLSNESFSSTIAPRDSMSASVQPIKSFSSDDSVNSFGMRRHGLRSELLRSTQGVMFLDYITSNYT